MTLLQALGLIVGVFVLAWGVVGFWRGLSLKPTDPETRAPGKGRWWRT
jgi:hypothetical protein